MATVGVLFQLRTVASLPTRRQTGTAQDQFGREQLVGSGLVWALPTEDSEAGYWSCYDADCRKARARKRFPPFALYGKQLGERESMASEIRADTALVALVWLRIGFEEFEQQVFFRERSLARTPSYRSHEEHSTLVAVFRVRWILTSAGNAIHCYPLSLIRLTAFNSQILAGRISACPGVSQGQPFEAVLPLRRF
jgi:hypothetical protein